MGVVPVEHALMALGLARLARGGLGPAVAALLGAALGGFAVHASYEHQRMAIGGYGRPRYEPDVPREANITHGLVFFDDDEGYQLANDPGMLASHGMLSARLRGDDHDRLLYDLLGHPAVHRYNQTASGASVTPWTPPGSGTETWRFEAEADFPPIGVVGGRAEVAEPKDPPTPCISDGRVLVLTPTGPRGAGEATAAIELPIPRTPTTPATLERRSWSVAPRVLQRAPALAGRPGGSGTLSLVLGETPSAGGPPAAEWTWSDPGGAAPSPGCVDLPAKSVELGEETSEAKLGEARQRAWLVLRATGGPVALDKTTLRAGPR
jgi:hypothetical protein